jgi:hypothetical protein
MSSQTNAPDLLWSDESIGGTRMRVALWLNQVVGEGNVFTKADLRAAFPEVEQIDRRMRDLRESGWVIETNRQDPTLAPAELRLRQIGDPVWLPDARKRQTAISASDRRRALQRYDYCCARCGVGAGSSFPDRPSELAVLTVRRLSLSTAPNAPELVVLCQRCSGPPSLEGDGERLAALLEHMSPEDRERLAGWLDQGRRPVDHAELAWHQLSRFSEESRRVFRRLLDQGAADPLKEEKAEV